MQLTAGWLLEALIASSLPALLQCSDLPPHAWQVNDFWQLLEVATNERQRVLLGAMNAHLAALSHTIEATVGELLDIQLEEAHIGLEQPSAAQWHETLDDLFAIGECCDLWVNC